MAGSAKFLEVPAQESVGVKIITESSGQFNIPLTVASNYQSFPSNAQAPPYFLVAMNIYQIFYVPNVPETDPPVNNVYFNLVFPRPPNNSYRVIVYNNAPTYAGYMMTYSGENLVFFTRQQSVPHDHPDENLIFPSSQKMFVGRNDGGWDVY